MIYSIWLYIIVCFKKSFQIIISSFLTHVVFSSKVPRRWRIVVKMRVSQKLFDIRFVAQPLFIWIIAKESETRFKIVNRITEYCNFESFIWNNIFDFGRISKMMRNNLVFICSWGDKFCWNRDKNYLKSNSEDFMLFWFSQKLWCIFYPLLEIFQDTLLTPSAFLGVNPQEVYVSQHSAEKYSSKSSMLSCEFLRIKLAAQLNTFLPKLL